MSGREFGVAQLRVDGGLSISKGLLVVPCGHTYGQPKPYSRKYFQNCRKARIALLAQSSIQALSAQASILRDLCHTFGSRNIPNCSRYPRHIIREFIQPYVKICRHLFRRAEMVCNVIRSQLPGFRDS